MRRLITPVVALVTLCIPGVAGASMPKADLSLMQAADARSASPGQIVTFTSYAVDNGPSASQLDASIVATVGLTVRHQRCQSVTPDTPFCEFGVLAPGITRRMTVPTRITGRIGDRAALIVCTSSEGTTVDPDPSNDCVTTWVQIVAPALDPSK
jgi:Domain of unknown function DUF11